MADTDAAAASIGQQLLALGLRQGTWFSAGQIDKTLRASWAGCRSEPALREKPIKDDALLMVLSQDCDIACRRDDDDPCVELAVFKRIKPRQRYPGNQFAHSVRKLQLSLGEQHYEAKVRETVRVAKQDLLSCLTQDPVPPLTALTLEACRTLVLWRANRYQRVALPDRFNTAFQPLLKRALPALECLAADPNQSSRSYIRALYVHLEHFNEEGPCQFSLMALLRADTADEIQSAIDDELEALCQALESANVDFRLSEAPELPGLAERESALTVATLALYVKLNLDELSLKQGDPDVGVVY